jgi:hypothetical protein
MRMPAQQATLTARGIGPALTIGHVGGLVLTAIVLELRHRFPAAVIRTRP